MFPSHDRVGEKNEYTGMTAHVGASFPLQPRLWGYLAGGVAIEEEYWELYDPMHILADDGKYYLSGDKSLSLSAAGGVAYQVTESFIIKGGYETGLGALNIGIGLKW